MFTDDKLCDHGQQILLSRGNPFLNHRDSIFADIGRRPQQSSDASSDTSSGSLSGFAALSPTRSDSPTAEKYGFSTTTTTTTTTTAIPRRRKTICNKKLYRCQQCKYVTDRKNNLKRHFVTMHEKCTKLLECCDMVFANKAALREHVVGCHKEGYGCRICGRTFCRKALLKRHITVHSGQKDYVCSICGYATSHKSNLDRHKRRHSQGYTNHADPENPARFLDVTGFKSSPELSPFSPPCLRDPTYLTTMIPNSDFISDRIFLHVACQKKKTRNGKYVFPKRLLFTHAASSQDGKLPPSPVESGRLLNAEKRRERLGICSSRRLAPALYRCHHCHKVMQNQLELTSHLSLHPEPPVSPQRPLTLVAKGKIRRWGFE